MFAVHAND